MRNLLDPDTDDTWVPHRFPRPVRVALRVVELILASLFIVVALAGATAEYWAMWHHR